jgi:hypothetical protein
MPRFRRYSSKSNSARPLRRFPFHGVRGSSVRGLACTIERKHTGGQAASFIAVFLKSREDDGLGDRRSRVARLQKDASAICSLHRQRLDSSRIIHRNHAGGCGFGHTPTLLQTATCESVYDMWFFCDAKLSTGGRVIDLFLEEGPLLSPGERRYLRLLRETAFRPYEVEDTSPGVSVTPVELPAGMGQKIDQPNAAFFPVPSLPGLFSAAPSPFPLLIPPSFLLPSRIEMLKYFYICLPVTMNGSANAFQDLQVIPGRQQKFENSGSTPFYLEYECNGEM